MIRFETYIRHNQIPCYNYVFQSNVVVIQQPQVVHTVRSTGTSDYGTGALVLAIGVTLFIVFCGCWWSLICSIAGIALAVNVSTNLYSILCMESVQASVTYLYNILYDGHL